MSAPDPSVLLRNWSAEAPSDARADALVPGLWSALGPARARVEYERLARQGGRRSAVFVPALLRWTRDLIVRGRAGQARPLLALVMRLEPRRADVRLLAGIERRFASDYSGAEARYREAVALAPAWPRAHLYAAENRLRAGRAKAALAGLRAGLSRCRRARPRDRSELAELYRLRAAAFDFAGAERAGERLMRPPFAAGTAELLCWVPIVEDFDLFRRPDPYLDALAAALRRYETGRPRSPWPPFFRVLFLGLCGYDPESDRADRDCERLGGLVSGRRDWMLAPAAIRAQAVGNTRLAKRYARRARAAGVRDHLVKSPG